MPVTVRKGSKEGEWLIVEVDGGRIVGRSNSKRKASIAASIRNRAIRGELSKEAIEYNINFFEGEGFSIKKAVDLAFIMLESKTKVP